MATRNIKDIVDDLRTAASDDSLDSKVLAEKTAERAKELEAIWLKQKADDKFAAIIALLVLLFIGAFAIITFMSNDDLRDDVMQKKEIINKFEQSVRHDTIHTYVDQDGNEITVPVLLDDNLKLMNKISDLEYKISLYEIQLRSIELQYGIKVVNDRHSFSIEGKEVDSAMLLLPVFRDRLSFDSVNNQWSISRRTIIRGDEKIVE